jgi:hypothetical protein
MDSDSYNYFNYYWDVDRVARFNLTQHTKIENIPNGNNNTKWQKKY